MKKIKSIGFAMLYLAIPIMLQFVVGGLIGIQMVVYSIFKGADALDPTVLQEKVKSDQFSLILTALVNLILIIGFGLWYYFIRTRKERQRAEYKKIFSGRSLWYTLGLAICSQFVSNLIMIGFRLAAPDTYSDYVKMSESFDIHVLPPLLLLFIVVVWSPLAEELVFRAMVFRTLRKGFSFPAAAVLSGVLFGVYHMNVVQGVYAALIGVLLAFAYEKTNSLWGCYLLHFMFNAANYAIAAIQKLTIIPETVLVFILLVLHVLSVVGIFYFAGRMSKLFKKKELTVKGSGFDEIV